MGCGGSKAATKTSNDTGSSDPPPENAGGEGETGGQEGANGTNETPNQDNTDTKTGEQTTDADNKDAPAASQEEQATGDDAADGEDKTITEQKAVDGERNCPDTKNDPSVLQDSEVANQSEDHVSTVKVDMENEESLPKNENSSEPTPKVTELENGETTVSE